MPTGAKSVRLTRETLRKGRAALRANDPRLGRWMDRIGEVGLRRQRPYFNALCRSIISQQVAAAAARTICGRFEAMFDSGKPNPAELLRFRPSRLRAAGLSRQKAEYLRALATEFHAGDLRRARFGALPNEEIIERLTRVKGIGRWTAEMFLIFSVGRIDVFSPGDLALRAGVARVVGRELSPPECAREAERWAPYRSVASLYLWRISHWKEESPGGASAR